MCLPTSAGSSHDCELITLHAVYAILGQVYLLKHIFLLLASTGFLLTCPVFPFMVFGHTRCLFSLMKCGSEV